MKDVLLLVHEDVGQEARFLCAIDIVKGLGGHLTCLDVVNIPELVTDSYGAAELLLDEEREREHGNRMRLEPRLQDAKVSWTWRDKVGRFGDCIDEAARLCDLVVVNRQLDTFPLPDMRRIVGETLIKTRKPVLAVPQTAKGIELFGQAMIAWDGSREAAAVLRVTLPLLRLATHVTLIEIDDGSVRTPAEDAMVYLGRQGICSTIRPKHPAVLGAGRELLWLVEDTQPDYLIMGGYGHSPMKEALFGGVTRHMLENSPVPLFLAH